MADERWAATSVVVGRGVTFAFGRQNPSHDQLPDLIANTAGMSVLQRRKVRKFCGRCAWRGRTPSIGPGRLPIGKSRWMACILPLPH